MIDGLITFYHSGFDAQVYCLCVGGYTAARLYELHKSEGVSDFVHGLANKLSYIAVLAGFGLLLVALVRYFIGCHESPDCSVVHQLRGPVVITVAILVSFGPLIYVWVISRPTFWIKPVEDDTPVLRLPAPETFAGKGEKS